MSRRINAVMPRGLNYDFDLGHSSKGWREDQLYLNYERLAANTDS